MTIQEFISNYKAKKFMNTAQGAGERSEYIRKELGIRSYVPFAEKREIAEMIVAKNIEEVDGIKKYDSIDGYISFITMSIMAHTNLELSDDIEAEYDLLAESGLLTHIIAEFQGSHEEIDLLRKMALEAELEDNNTNALVGRFLNKVSDALDDVVEIVKDRAESLDLGEMFGVDINKEDIAQFMSVLNKLK